MRIEYTCSYCGLGFEDKPSAGRRFCSKPCADRGKTRKPVAERFWNKVKQGPACWDWNGAVLPTGYGVVNAGGHDGATLLAHRVSYELHHGPVPDGLYILHTCDNPPCTRPDHLVAGTQAENIRQAVRRGRLVNGRRKPA